MLSENLQPKEIEYLKYLKSKGFNAQDSFSRLDNAKTKGLFGEVKQPEKIQQPTQKPIQKEPGVMDIMKKTFAPITPKAETIKSIIPSSVERAVKAPEQAIGAIEKTGEIAKGGVERIEEAGVGLATGKYTTPEAFIRGGAGALQTAGSPLFGAIGQGIEEQVKKIPDAVKQDIMETAEPTIEGVKTWWGNQTPEQQRNLANIGVSLEVLSYFVGGSTVKKPLGQAFKDVIKSKPTVGPVPPKALQFQAPKTPSIIQNTILKSKKGLGEIKTRIETGPQEIIGKVGQKPVIKPLVTKKPVVEKGIDIAKSDDLIRRGLKPSVTGKTTEFAYKKVNTDLRKGIEHVSKSKGIPKDGVDAMKKTADRKKEIYKTIENNNELVKLKTNIDDIEVRLNKYLGTEEGKAFSAVHPGMRSKIGGIVDNWRTEYGATISQKQMQLLKQEFNKTLAKGDFAKMIQGPNSKALADAKISQTLGNILDDNVMKVLGKTNRSLNLEYGAVRNLEKALAKRMGVFNRNTKGGLGSLIDTFNAGDIAMGLATGDLKQAGTGLVRKLSLGIIKGKENPNRIIKELFQLHGIKKPTIGTKIQKMIGKEDVEVKGKPLKGYLPEKTGAGKQKTPIKLREDMSKSRPKTTKTTPSKPVLATKRGPLMLKEGTRITPQTVEKAVIQESKKELRPGVIKKPLSLKVKPKIVDKKTLRARGEEKDLVEGFVSLAKEQEMLLDRLHAVKATGVKSNIKAIEKKLDIIDDALELQLDQFVKKTGIETKRAISIFEEYKLDKNYGEKLFQEALKAKK